jgi:hypothetical protein
MAYRVAAAGRSLVQSNAAGSGIPARVPFGTAHAYSEDEGRTLCGIDLSELYMFPDLEWATAVLELRCAICERAAR